MYKYILIKKQFTLHSNQAQPPLLPSWVSFLRLSDDLLAASFFSAVSSIVSPPMRGLPSPNCHNHGLTLQTLLPRLPPSAAASAQSNSLPRQHHGNLPWCSKDMVEQPVLRKSSTTVSFLVCPCTYSVQTRYVQVCTEYVLVCTNIYQSTANLWVEGTSDIRVFASRCAPRNPVKPASVLYIKVCTGTHQVHTSIYWSVSCTYLYILSICWYIWVCTGTYPYVLSTY